MFDKNFFHKNESLSLLHIKNKCAEKACLINFDKKFNDVVIGDVAPLNKAIKGCLSFLDNPKYIEDFIDTNATACFAKKEHVDKVSGNLIVLETESPYFAYSIIASELYSEKSIKQEELISKSAQIEKSTYLSPNVFVGDDVKIGKNCFINPGVVISSGVVIKDNVKIGANASISYSLIGNNVIVHQGAQIGQDGFGFATHNGVHHKVPQLGRVIIGDHVEIGANTTIDRGSARDTVIGDGTKIDNLVQIAHNVEIGKNCIIVAQVAIAGSAKIGNYVVMGGQSAVVGHIEIGDFVQVGAQSGVTKNLKSGEKVLGSPSMPIDVHHKQVGMMRRMVKQLKNKKK